jgi:hypothetical protein
MSIGASKKRVSTTVRLPRPLYEEARSFVEKGVGNAQTINDFFVAAIRAYVKLLQRKQIDAGFAGMAEDADYRKEAKLIGEEFSQSDWEAFEAI